ncbi:MAG: hypothetical protein K2J26_01815, partial [Ruminococcus sp.]|nr:hypothetical protein [Ruminococcus sp.]
MNITLITATFNDEVHGTFNDKKTGCGINLQKPENVTRYRRSGQMKNMGEITCEKCKAKIAKEMIKADSKEMKAMLKEERLRAKRGIEDEGIVPLGNTTARITSPQNVRQPEPEPEPIPAPEPPKPAYQPNVAPAIDNELAQFAIKRPDEEPAPDMSRQFVPEPPKFFDSEPEPPVQENESVDDFLAQFAIQKPDDTPPEPEQTEEDFLAQFAISAPPKEEPVPEPAKPPVIDDISAALETMQQNPVRPVSASAPEPEADDIMKMFNIGSQNNSVPQVSGVSAPAEYAVPEQSDEELSEWDIIANQLFGGEVSEPVQPKIPQTVSVPEPVKPDDLFDEPQYMKTPTGPKEMDELPSIDEILAEHSGKTETVHYGTPIPEQPVSAP